MTLLRPTLFLLIGLSAPLSAQHALAGGGAGADGRSGPYDPAVPTPATVLGHELGEAFTPHHLIARYAEAVAEASPRVRLDTVGATFEGREMLLITVTSEANQARLESIRAANARLADPRGLTAEEEARLVAGTPTVVWLGYTIHGNEASGVEAGLGVLYELAAGQDAATRMVLDSVVVLIDPVQNPDGHERHVQDVMRDRGVFGPDPYPGSMVNASGWPGARTSHYLFDLNRDWFLHTHPETRARMATWAQWHPHVAVDLHEMGANSTYFFAPPMEPINPNVDPSIERWWDVFARGNAEALGAEGWGFFTREGYDEFYPGYGVSWPVLTGAVGMTYEQASSDGGAIRRDDGSILTLREAARHHYTASLATLRTAAARRADRVRDYATFRRTAVTGRERQPLRTVVFEPDAQGRSAALVEVLLRNGIEVGRLTADPAVRATPFGDDDAARVRLPAGAWVVDLAQPQGRLATALLEPDAALDSTFIREELAARAAGERDRFYDITAWSLPYTFRVDAWWTGEAVGPVEAVEGIRPVESPGGVVAVRGTGGGNGDPGPTSVAGVPLPDRAGYAYAFEPGSEASLRMLAGLLADSARVRHAPRSFRVGARSFPRGAFVVLVNRNAPDIHDRVRALAAETGALVTAVHNALVDEGTDLGSNSVRALPVPRVALVGGDGISAYSFGAAWYAFDQRLRFPVTRVELDGLPRALPDFDVVVLPSAFDLGGPLGERGAEALRDWVRDGGTLITLEGATEWLGREESARFRRAELADPDADPDAGPDAGPNTGPAGAVGADESPPTAGSGRAGEPEGAPLPVSIPGAIARTVVADSLSPLLAGVTDRVIPVQLSGDVVYRAPEDVRPGEVVLRYADETRLRLAGYLWPEAPARVAGTPWLWTERVGDGRVIAFAGDPNFRGLWRGLLPIFANAVLLGPSL